MERIYTIPLREAKKAPRSKRTQLAVKSIREFVSRHMKNETVKLDRALNEEIWATGMKNIPPRIKVKASTQGDGSILVTLAE
jgi:large subunit ribosomal protein L31e